MASEQQQRRVRDENVSEARDVGVEKDLVPNLASHFESLAEKVRDSEVVGAKEVPTGEDKSKVSITLAGKHGGQEERHYRTGTQMESKAKEEVTGVSRSSASEKMASESKNRASEMMEGVPRSVGKFEGNRVETQSESKTPTLEEISKVRQQAQQNSMDTIRKAEQRAEQKKTETGVNESKSAPAYGGVVLEKGRQGYEYAKEKLAGAGQTAAEYTKGTAGKAGEAVTRSTQAAPEYGRVAMEKSQQGLGYAKDKLATAGQTAAEYSKQTAEQARNIAARGAEYSKQTAEQAKNIAAKGAEGTVGTAKNVKDYTAEKAAAAKDVTVESGKGAASMVGTVTGEVVDRAAMVGWGAAHLTAEVAVEGTKMAAKAVTGVAGYAKDTAASVGSKVSEIAVKQAENVKEVAASTGEKAKEYTARKQEEARRDLQCKKASGTGTGTGTETETTTQVEGGGLSEKVEGEWESTKGAVSSGVGKTSEGVKQKNVQQGSGVVGAIGETIMEIAQQTTELLAPGGQDDDSFLTDESGRGVEQRVSK